MSMEKRIIELTEKSVFGNNDALVVDNGSSGTFKITNPVETSLTTAGKLADAKATGDRLTAAETAATALAGRVTTAEGDIDSLDARITNLATLTEGSTTGDAELIDARVVGSTTYSSLHEAIDTEFTNVKSALSDTTGNTALVFSDPTLKQYIKTNGSTVDWDTPSTSSSTNIKWCVVQCSEGDVFTINGKGGSADRLWAFADSSKNILINSNLNVTATNLVLIAPENSAYLIVNDETDKQSYIGKLLVSEVNQIKEFLPSEILIAQINDFGTGKYINATVGSDWTTGLVTSSGSLYTTSALNLSGHIGDNLIIEIGSSDAHTGIRELGFCNSNNIASKIYNEGNLSFESIGNYQRATLPISNTHMFLSCSSKTFLNIYIGEKGSILKTAETDVKYVATNGNDNNSGDEATPFATVNHALEMGAKRVCVKGGVYEQTIDLGLTNVSNISIVNATPTEKTVFIHPSSLLADSETAVSGYTKVYSATVSQNFSNGNKWIFQDGIADESTEITAEERMPEQRGYKYRCYDTKIILASADNTADALTEIESSDEYKWYSDGTTLYFSRPAPVTATNPIRGSFNDKLFANPARKLSLHMVGIDVKYMSVNVRDMSNCRIVDCSVANVFGDGGFVFRASDGIEFIRCEASRVYSGLNGDGFNAHSTNEGDAFAHQTTALVVDCWSHDNSDDGISLHERSEFTVIGGLYEQNYNGGGITPANGSHCTCIGVMARKNGEGGFLYMNAAAEAEGGVGGQIKCIDCISESNNIWYSAISAGYKINSAGNKGIMINCKAIGEDRGYYVSDNAGAMILIDCGAVDCTDVKGGKVANITVKNTVLVE